jgi:hypothetical protein
MLPCRVTGEDLVEVGCVHDVFGFGDRAWAELQLLCVCVCVCVRVCVCAWACACVRETIMFLCAEMEYSHVYYSSTYVKLYIHIYIHICI